MPSTSPTLELVEEIQKPLKSLTHLNVYPRLTRSLSLSICRHPSDLLNGVRACLQPQRLTATVHHSAAQVESHLTRQSHHVRCRRILIMSRVLRVTATVVEEPLVTGTPSASTMDFALANGITHMIASQATQF